MNCPHCGNPVAERSSFCGDCGGRIRHAHDCGSRPERSDLRVSTTNSNPARSKRRRSPSGRRHGWRHCRSHC